MARTTPAVHGDRLVWRDGGEERSIAVGSSEWHDWLSTANLFFFASPRGSFTARKERFQRGGCYWKAYRNRGGQLYRAYLGKAESLTLERLNAIAASLAVDQSSDRRPVRTAQVAGKQDSSDPVISGVLEPDRSESLANRGTYDSVLTTKLSLPPTGSDLVARPRLIEQLSQGLRRKLTLITAPAGSGKTTLLSQWKLSGGLHFALVALDDSDNDPTRFWTYVIAALQTLHPHIGEHALALLRSSQHPPVESVLTVLINSIASAPEDLALVLDDYHVIESRSIHQALAYLIDHLPPQMHIVLASRVDPPLPLARMRGRGQLIELRATDLSFTTEETLTFLNEVMRLGLSTEHVAALEKRTEGWIVGLQLAALSLQGCEDAGEFIKTFSGDHQYILDYLMEEIFSGQPRGIQSFLLQTSILDRLSGSLCDAVTRQVNSQATLEDLARANLFTIPLDNERRWYRYHHLFADFLRACLHRLQPGKVADYHRRASSWYSENGLANQAIDHALSAGEHDTGAVLIEQNTLAMFRRGELTTFMGWMSQLPGHLVRSRPRLGLYNAWALATSLQFDAAEARLREVEDCLATAAGEAPATSVLGQDIDVLDLQRIRDELVGVSAMVAAHRDEDSITIALSREALERLPEGHPMRGEIAFNLRLAYWWSGDTAGACQDLSEGNLPSQADGHASSAIVALSQIAGMQAVRGKLHRAARTYRQAFELEAEQRLPLVSFAGALYIGLSWLLYEWNDLGAAMRYVTEGMELGKRSGSPLIMILGYGVLARINQAQGSLEGAFEAILEAERWARTSRLELMPRVAEYRARLWLAQGKLENAIRWAESAGLRADDRLSYRHEAEYMTLARLRVAQGRPAEGVELLTRLLNAAESAGRTGRVIKILALRALALEAGGRTVEALDSLAEALSLGEPEGFVRTFVDGGTATAALLAKLLEADQRKPPAARQPVSVHYVIKLLAALNIGAGLTSAREGSAPPSSRIVSQGSSPALFEPLSQRELQVLRFLAVGASNQDIAQRIVVTTATVKKHISNIYDKLSVHSRTQAIARARELGLLPRQDGSSEYYLTSIGTLHRGL